MVFFPKVLAFFQEITNIWQKSRDFCFGLVFLETFKIQRLAWIFLWIFDCLISISSMFILICTNIHLIKCCFIKDLLWKHSCGKRLCLSSSPSPFHTPEDKQAEFRIFLEHPYFFNKIFKKSEMYISMYYQCTYNTYIVGPSFNIYFLFLFGLWAWKKPIG